MTSRDYIQKYNDELIHITTNITKGSEEAMDLYQTVIEQILSNPDKMDQIDDEEKKYFFIKIVKTNWYSKTSPYQYQKRKRRENEIDLQKYSFFIESIPDEIEEKPTLEWVNKELETMDWFDRDIFILWTELKTLTKVHEETTIPINSVGKYINKVKKELRQRWTKR